jgi:hypothetical protein
MRLTLLLCSLLVLCAPLSAQKHDNTWVLGYDGFGVEYGHSLLTFDDGKLKIDTISYSMPGYDIPRNNASFSLADGSLFAFFNGIQIQNSQFQALENGENLSEEVEKYYYYMSHPLLSQGSLFIPFPGKPDSVLLLYSSQRFLLDNTGLIEAI